MMPITLGTSFFRYSPRFPRTGVSASLRYAITPNPVYGCNASGMRIEPSAC